jgi:hypothetical protein
MPDTHPTPEPSACPFDDPREFAPPLSEATLSARPFAIMSTSLLRIQLETATSEEERAGIEREIEIRNGVVK